VGSGLTAAEHWDFCTPSWRYRLILA
jgi:hypothetical protein